MERPFDSSNGASEHDFSRTVFEQGARPHLNPKWPETLRDLLKQSWCHNRDDRLSMEDISKAIRTELVKLRQGDESGLGDYQRRRSTSVFGGDSRSLFNEVKESVLDASLDKSRKSYAE